MEFQQSVLYGIFQTLEVVEMRKIYESYYSLVRVVVPHLYSVWLHTRWAVCVCWLFLWRLGRIILYTLLSTGTSIHSVK